VRPRHRPAERPARAFWAVAAIAVVGGQSLLKIVNITTIRFATAAILTALAAYVAWAALR
jgi:putative Ca2+/H+ antiporter (TMEM165/GDT1 family)